MNRFYRLLKRIFFALVPLLLLSLVVELIFYWAIGDQYYKLKLQNTINYLSRSDEPERDLAWWEDNSITIRSEEFASRMVEFSHRNDAPDTYQRRDLGGYNTKSIKPSDINRTNKKIYVVGCSCAYGYNVRYDSTFEYLLEKYAGGKYQVINAGQVGWSSIQLVPVVKRIVDLYHPSTVILFMSNNEWKNWAPHKTSVAMASYWQVVSYCTHSYTLSYLLYQAIMHNQKSGIQTEAVKMSVYQSYNMNYFKEYKYALRNPIEKYYDFSYDIWASSKQKYLNNFEKNLREMASYCRQHRVNVVLMTMRVNYRLSPSWSTPQPVSVSAAHHDIVKRLTSYADSLVDGMQLTEAAALIDSAISIEPDVAIPHYIKGTILMKQGKHIEAEKSFSRSRECMIGDLGSVISINERIKYVGKVTQSDVIDLDSVFLAYLHSRGAYYNDDLIDDDCHPNEKGHELLAKYLVHYFSDR